MLSMTAEENGPVIIEGEEGKKLSPQLGSVPFDSSESKKYGSEASDLDFQVNDFQVNLDFFSGPLDLLLHLVSQQEVPIERVSLKEVLDQYLEIVLSQSHNIDLEKASEYLVIAATLMVLKSKALIPQNNDEADETEDLPEYSRFFEDLRARLIAYENTRLKAQALIEAPQLDVDTFVRRDKSVLNVPPEMLAEGEEVGRLGKLFLSLVKRVGGMSKTYNISLENISIVSYMMKVVDIMKLPTFVGRSSLMRMAITFSRNLKNSEFKEENSRNIILGSFIAILELAKRGLVKVSQENDYADVKMELSMKEFDVNQLDTTNFESEFDVKKEFSLDEEEAPHLEVVNGSRR